VITGIGASPDAMVGLADLYAAHRLEMVRLAVLPQTAGPDQPPKASRCSYFTIRFGFGYVTMRLRSSGPTHSPKDGVSGDTTQFLYSGRQDSERTADVR
jgi:hypothetical protein